MKRLRTAVLVISLALISVPALTASEDLSLLLQTSTVNMVSGAQGATVVVSNSTRYTVTAFNLNFDATFTDGTTMSSPGQIEDMLLTVAREKVTGLDGHVPGRTLYVGESRTVPASIREIFTAAQSHGGKIVSLVARPTMIAFDDGTAIGDKKFLKEVSETRRRSAKEIQAAVDAIDELSRSPIISVPIKANRLMTAAEVEQSLQLVDKLVADVEASQSEDEGYKQAVLRQLSNVRALLSASHADGLPELRKILSGMIADLNKQSTFKEVTIAEKQ